MQTTKRITDMAPTERPYEKFLTYGSRALTDAELLAIIIRTGTQGMCSLDIAEKVLHLKEPDQGILGIHHSTLEQLMAVQGVGKVKAIQLKCIAELARRFAKAQAYGGLSFNEPKTIAEYYMEDFRHEEKEKCVVLMLDSKCTLLKESHISTGTVNASLMSPREIFKDALGCNAVSIIVMHNHPSGDPKPSNEDIVLTKRIKACGDLLGVPMVDHIIMGDHCYASLKELGLLR